MLHDSKEKAQMTFKIFGTALALLLVLGIFALPAQANTGGVHVAPVESGGALNLKPLVALGAGLVTVGGGLGIGKLAASAMDGTARQPEAGGAIRTSMIIAAALIEGFTFFALIVCIMST